MNYRKGSTTVNGGMTTYCIPIDMGGGFNPLSTKGVKLLYINLFTEI